MLVPPTGNPSRITLEKGAGEGDACLRRSLRLRMLVEVVDALFPARAKRLGRGSLRTALQEKRDLTVAQLAAAIRALNDPGSDRPVDAEVVDALLLSIGQRTPDDTGDKIPALLSAVGPS